MCKTITQVAVGDDRYGDRARTSIQLDLMAIGHVLVMPR
jgi:hypothetical protein